MIFEDWLNESRNEYKINIELNDGNNHFTAKKYHFSDPTGNGLSFTICLNDEYKPSLFDTDEFPFERFNIAEGIKSEDILNAAEKCLKGEISLKERLLGKVVLEFSVGKFKISSVPAKRNNNTQYWLKGYIRQ